VAETPQDFNSDLAEVMALIEERKRQILREQQEKEKEQQQPSVEAGVMTQADTKGSHLYY
jgi:hypothetical protein